MADIHTKRVYEPAASQDGFRVLVDRLWPRGMTKEKVKADLWMKDVAPSTTLREWYHQDRTMWEEFKNRYFRELDANQASVELLLEKAELGRLTLLYGARDAEYNQAVVLREYLLSRFARKAA